MTDAEFIKNWNFCFPLDYLYRQEKGITFNSEEHRRLSPFIVRNYFVERAIMEPYLPSSKSKQKGGISKKEKELFDSISLDDLNKQRQEQKKSEDGD